MDLSKLSRRQILLTAPAALAGLWAATQPMNLAKKYLNQANSDLKSEKTEIKFVSYSSIEQFHKTWEANKKEILSYRPAFKIEKCFSQDHQSDFDHSEVAIIEARANNKLIGFVAVKNHRNTSAKEQVQSLRLWNGNQSKAENTVSQVGDSQWTAHQGDFAYISSWHWEHPLWPGLENELIKKSQELAAQQWGAKAFLMFINPDMKQNHLQAATQFVNKGLFDLVDKDAFYFKSPLRTVYNTVLWKAV